MFNDVCTLSISIFMVLCAMLSAISAFKTKNLTGYLIHTGQFYTCFYILNSIFTKDLNPDFIIIALSVILAMYAMVRIYKNSRINTHIFTALLCAGAFLLPFAESNILFNIYVFDKTGFFALNALLLCNILIIIKTLKIVESLYKIKLNHK